MSPAAVVQLRPRLSREDKAAILGEAFAVLGGAFDPLRAVWDGRATVKDRRLLLAMAGRPVGEAARLSALSWGDMRPEVRAAVVGGLRRWKSWAGRLA